MRLLIVSDLHANASALERVVEAADAVVFLGDAVDYGPDPAAAVAWVRDHATWAVRGNHDHAVATGVETGASPRLRAVAEESAALTRVALTPVDRTFLGSLSLTVTFSFGGTVFQALHAAPSDPLHLYLPPSTPDETWETELGSVTGEWLLYGHTHLPFLRRFGDRMVLNPGSVGQPRDGVPMAAYAVWEDGDVFLVRRAYAAEEVVERVARLRLDERGRAQLVEVLRTGR